MLINVAQIINALVQVEQNIIILHCKTGFDLTTRDLYFTILVEIFTSHILAENTHFTNCIE